MATAKGAPEPCSRDEPSLVTGVQPTRMPLSARSTAFNATTYMNCR